MVGLFCCLEKAMKNSSCGGMLVVLVTSLESRKKSNEREREADKGCSRQNFVFSHPMRHSKG